MQNTYTFFLCRTFFSLHISMRMTNVLSSQTESSNESGEDQSVLFQIQAV